MQQIYVPNHRYPVRNMGISASHNIRKSQDRSDRKVARDYVKYIRTNRMASIKFERTLDSIEKGYDEMKALFPVYEGISLFEIQTMASVLSGMNTRVTGCLKTGERVKHLNDYLSQEGISADLGFVPELDSLVNGVDSFKIYEKERKKLTLTNSLRKLKGALNLEKSVGTFIFSCGDTIVYDFLRSAYDKDIISNSLVLDLNGIEIIDAPIPRNPYHQLVDPDGNIINFKEPNLYVFGEEFNLGAANEVFGLRTLGGIGPLDILQMLSVNMYHHWDMVTKKDKATLKNLACEYLKVLNTFGKHKPTIDQIAGSEIGRFINMSPMVMKAEHTDFFRMKDVDAIHDYVFVRRLIEKHLDKIFPPALVELIKGYAKYLKDNNIPVAILEVGYYLNEKVDRLQIYVDKKINGHKIPKIFSDDGLEFIGQPNPDENIDKAADRKARDLEEFMKEHEDKKLRIAS